jgi:hypothetical protein
MDDLGATIECGGRVNNIEPSPTATRSGLPSKTHQTGTKGTRRADRRELRTIVVHVEKDIFRAFKILCAEELATTDALMHEALELLFLSRNDKKTLRLLIANRRDRRDLRTNRGS